MLVELAIKNFRKFDRYALDLGERNLLVGPNNAGKSTLIEALRLVSVVVNRFGGLNFDAPPDWLRDKERSRGVSPSLRGLDFTLGRETFYQYNDPPAEITAGFASGSSVTAYIGPDADVFAVVRDPDGIAITTKGQARMFEQPKIAIQPQVGPLTRMERPLADRYVKGALDSTLAPTHFRNQLRLLDQYFDDFRTAAEATWPVLRIDGLELMGVGDECHLELFIRDGPFVGEVAAMGHGLQMWLQLMWFLARAKSHGTLVLDEPDVYMHPDLQRRLVRFLLQRRQQVIIATHSIEMMAEVEPHELVPVDSSQRHARHASTVRDVQAVVEQVGGVHNIEFARLSRAPRYLVIAPADLRLLKRFHDVLVPSSDQALDLVPTFPLHSWEDWPYVVAMKRAIDASTDSPPEAVCLLGRGLHSIGEMSDRHIQAEADGIDLHVWQRRELANYLLVPDAIERAARSFNPDGPSAPIIARQLDRIMQALAIKLSATNPNLAEFLSTREGQLACVPARLVLLRLSAWLKSEHACRVGLPDIVSALHATDLVPEVHRVVEAVDAGRAVSAEAGRDHTRISWPEYGTPQSAIQPGGDERVDEILGLFEDAGVISAN